MAYWYILPCFIGGTMFILGFGRLPLFLKFEPVGLVLTLAKLLPQLRKIEELIRMIESP
jgi:hypothetical protein